MKLSTVYFTNSAGYGERWGRENQVALKWFVPLDKISSDCNVFFICHTD